MSKQLPVVVLPTTAIEIFSCDKINDLVSAIEDQARSIVPDLSSDKGRKAIASNAAAVSRSKTALDALGKNLVSGWKNKAKAVDVERKEMRDRLDSLRDEVRKPLTDWDAEQIAIATAKLAAKKLLEEHGEALAENDLFDRMREVERKEAEQAQIEQERLDKEAAEKAEAERIEHDERIRKEAAQRAHKEALEAAERAEQESATKIKAAEDAAKQSELEKIEAEQRAEIQAENAEREKKEAADRARQAEIDRQADEQRKADAEQAKLEANKKHVGLIRKAAEESLIEFDGINETLAKRIVIAISLGEISNITINY